MTGEQCYQIPPRLHENFFNFVWFYDLDLHHLVGERIPQVADRNLISNFQQLNMPENSAPYQPRCPARTQLVLPPQWA